MKSNKKASNQVFPIRKPSDFRQYFYRLRKIQKSVSSQLYDITTFKKQFSLKRISVSTQNQNIQLQYSEISKVTATTPTLFTCSKSAIETPKQFGKIPQS